VSRGRDGVSDQPAQQAPDADEQTVEQADEGRQQAADGGQQADDEGSETARMPMAQDLVIAVNAGGGVGDKQRSPGVQRDAGATSRAPP
jgi:hypothetical protein